MYSNFGLGGSSLTAGFLGGSFANAGEPRRLVISRIMAKSGEDEKRISLEDRLFQEGL
jgi:hypothetical protein